MYFEKALLWNSLGVKNQLIYYKVKRFKASSCNPVFFMILSFAALKVFFNMFFLKLRVEWRRLWKSSKNFEISVFNLKLFFFFRLDRASFTTLFPRWPTFWNTKLKRTTLFRCCRTLLTSMLKYTTLFQRWFEVASRRDVISTKRQRWSNFETFTGYSASRNKMNNWLYIFWYLFLKYINIFLLYILLLFWNIFYSFLLYIISKQYTSWSWKEGQSAACFPHASATAKE